MSKFLSGHWGQPTFEMFGGLRLEATSNYRYESGTNIMRIPAHLLQRFSKQECLNCIGYSHSLFIVVSSRNKDTNLIPYHITSSDIPITYILVDQSSISRGAQIPASILLYLHNGYIFLVHIQNSVHYGLLK